ncbi:MAG: GNAT family N-acetyltransferase [Pseudomonadota bacterium]
MSRFSVTTMGQPELDTAVGWAQAEGWNPGTDDAPAFLAADEGGFLMGHLDDEPVSSISVVRYGETYGFLGFYICRPEYRGQGFGLKTWDAGMARLEGRTVGLDGVVEQQDNYRKSGFVLAHNNIRHGGCVDVDQGSDRSVRTVSLEDVAAILRYDGVFFPADRSRFVSAWLSGAGTRRARVCIEDGEVRGYGVVRQCDRGSKIGPLFADTEAIAERLFLQLAAAAPDMPVYLDTPETNPAAVALARRNGLEPVFETARMYRGEAPQLPADRTFGITTFELG